MKRLEETNLHYILLELSRFGKVLEFLKKKTQKIEIFKYTNFLAFKNY